MKKILLIILTFFIGVTISKAEEIKYDWGLEITYNNSYPEIINLKVHKDYYESILYTYDYEVYERNLRYYVASSDGTVKKDLKFDNEDYRKVVILNDIIIAYYETYDSDDNETYWYDIYDKDLKLIKKVEGTSSITRNNYNLISETDKYYIWGTEVFDKKTNEIVDFEELIENFQYKDELFEAINEGNTDNIYKYINLLYETYFPNTHLPVLASIMSNQELYSKYENNGLVKTYYNGKYLAILYYGENYESYALDIFNNKGELVLKDFSISSESFELFFDENKFYKVSIAIDASNLEDGVNTGIIGNINIKGYDYNGNEKYNKNTNKIESGYYYDELDNYFDIYRIIFSSGLTTDGFFIVTTYAEPVGDDSIIDENETIDGRYDTLQKYYFINQIETKTDGKGTIEAIESSRPGEPVQFIVTPNEGYELNEVKVTDANGNVVVFTDYTFTMPSTDVTIEATFNKVKPNPDTLDNRIALACIILVIGIGSIIYNKKKRIWLE